MSRLLAGSALLGRSIRPLRPLRPSHSTRRLCGPPSAPPPPPSAATSAAAESAAPAGAAASGLAVAKEKIVGRLEWFMSCLHDYPLRTNAASTGVLCALGDALSQAVEWRLRISSPEKAEYNWQRTARMTFWGGCICGPVLSLWYRTLNTASEALVVSYQPVVSSGRLSWLLERTPMTGWLTALRREKELGVTSAQQLLGKVLADSVLFQAPFLNLYFAVTGLLEGLSPSATFEKTREVSLLHFSRMSQPHFSHVSQSHSSPYVTPHFLAYVTRHFSGLPPFVGVVDPDLHAGTARQSTLCSDARTAARRRISTRARLVFGPLTAEPLPRIRLAAEV